MQPLRAVAYAFSRKIRPKSAHRTGWADLDQFPAFIDTLRDRTRVTRQDGNTSPDTLFILFAGRSTRWFTVTALAILTIVNDRLRSVIALAILTIVNDRLRSVIASDVGCEGVALIRRATTINSTQYVFRTGGVKPPRFGPHASPSRTRRERCRHDRECETNG